jgi:hypothetical protein
MVTLKKSPETNGEQHPEHYYHRLYLRANVMVNSLHHHHLTISRNQFSSNNQMWNL